MALSESLRIKSTMPWFVSLVLWLFESAPPLILSHLRHDGLAVVALDVTEGHLRALVLVELELRKVEVGDVVEGN